MDYKFLADVGIICNKALTTAAMLRKGGQGDKRYSVYATFNM
jgi:hypothetical protein